MNGFWIALALLIITCSDVGPHPQHSLVYRMVVFLDAATVRLQQP